MILLPFPPKTKPWVPIPFPSLLFNHVQKPSSYNSRAFHHALPPRLHTPTQFVSMNRKGRVFLDKCSKNDSPLPVEEKDEDNGALQAVLKLYDAIKRKNVLELSEILKDDCQCGCNFIPFYWSFRGKKQVLAFFTYLMRSLGSNIEIVVQPPTLQDGLSVGVSWKLESNKKSRPLGKGFSFHLCQVYQGKALIRNVEMFMEPLLHVDELVLKLVAFVKMVMEKTSSFAFPEGKRSKRAMYILLALLLAVTFMFFS